ncbi:MAG TPA: hypothetical protein VGG39_37875 [Polyangiaceae bacterium]|jgi:hypothetical protein
MAIFGPQYPFRLQQVIDHAERFVALLTSMRVRGEPSGDVARAWLTGRVEEIESVLGTLVADWRGGRLSESSAVAAVSSYLGAMHAAAERQLGTEAEAECCRSDVANTIPLTAYGDDGATADTLPGSPAALADSERPER